MSRIGFVIACASAFLGCGSASEEPTAKEQYVEMLTDAFEQRAEIEAMFPHRRAEQGPWYLDALLNTPPSGSTTADVLSRHEAIRDSPVQQGRDTFELSNLAARAQFHMNEVAGELGSPTGERSIRAFAILESHLDAMHSTGTLVAPYSLANQHHTWLAEQLGAGEVGPVAAQRLLDILGARIVLSPEQEGQRWTSQMLASNWLYDWQVAQQLEALGQPYVVPGSFDRYRAIAEQLGDALARSIDAPAAFRIDRAEEHGDLWFEAISMRHEPIAIRDHDSVYGYNAALGRLLAARAEHRGFMTNLAAILYREQAGVWPESLDELVPEFLDRIPLDPCNGEALRYQRLDDADKYRLYSVGWDGTDDGGRHDPAQNATLPPSSMSFRQIAGYDERLDPWAPD